MFRDWTEAMLFRSEQYQYRYPFQYYLYKLRILGVPMNKLDN